MRSIFGWDLPPGVTEAQINAAAEGDYCEICNEGYDDCVCLPCYHYECDTRRKFFDVRGDYDCVENGHVMVAPWLD